MFLVTLTFVHPWFAVAVYSWQKKSLPIAYSQLINQSLPRNSIPFQKSLPAF